MKRETIHLRDNRAVTPFFRVFGGRRGEVPADEIRSEAPGMHRPEWRVLGVLMPALPAVAIFDGLWRLGGPWLAWLGVLPGLFLALHALSFGFGRRSPVSAFWCWSALFTLWSWWGIGVESGPVLVTAWFWLGFLGLQLVGLVALGWRRMMRLPGRNGILVRMVLAVILHVVMAIVWWRFGWPWGVVAGAGLAVLFCWGTLRPASRLYGRVATRVRGKGVLITLDDGPDPDDTPAVLELLDRHGVKAVFFLIGDKVRDFPDLVREIVARGHEVANHTMTHPQASMWCAGPGRTRREIVECQRVLEEVAGVKPRWFRAPVGHSNFFTHPVTDELGLEVVAWSRRAFDAVERDVDQMTARLTEGAGDGDVLLLHQGTPVTLELLERVLEQLSASGLLEHDEVAVEGGASPEGRDAD